MVWWKNDSSGHNVHVRAISTHYAVIWKVMELKPAWGTELPRAPSAGPRERLHMLSDNTLPWQHWGGWRHELWVNLIGWLCSQTSLRAMKRGVCCTKLRWINVYTCTYHTHTHWCQHLWCLFPAVTCCLLFKPLSSGGKTYVFTGWHIPQSQKYVDTWLFHLYVILIEHVIATPWALMCSDNSLFRLSITFWNTRASKLHDRIHRHRSDFWSGTTIGETTSVPSRTFTNHCWKINLFYDVTTLRLRFGWV